MAIQEVPKKWVLKGVDFFEADLWELRSIFPIESCAEMAITKIRQTPVLKKAIEAGAIVTFGRPYAVDSVLTGKMHLTQEGKMLIGKV